MLIWEVALEMYLCSKYVSHEATCSPTCLKGGANSSLSSWSGLLTGVKRAGCTCGQLSFLWFPFYLAFLIYVFETSCNYLSALPLYPFIFWWSFSLQLESNPQIVVLKHSSITTPSAPTPTFLSHSCSKQRRWWTKLLLTNLIQKKSCVHVWRFGTFLLSTEKLCVSK